MIVIDHGVWQRYTPENAEVIDGRPVIYLRNEEGADFYRFLTFMEPGTCLVEVWTDSGDILNFTGDENAPDLTCHFPAGRRLLEVRPARTDLKGMRWDGQDFVAIPERVPNITQRQLRLWLVRNGYPLATVETALDNLPEPDRSEALIEWEYASEFKPDHPTLLAVAAVLGIPDVAQAAREAALI